MDPDRQLIDHPPVHELDLAVFDVPEFLMGQDNYFHQAPRWPPGPISENDVVIYGGYPQVLRSKRPGEHKVDFPFQWFACKVQDADTNRIVLEPGIATVYWPGHEGEPINTSFGGQSGGPVYRLIEANSSNREIADRLELIGIVDRQIMGHLILARPLSVVDPDGHLLRPLGQTL